MAVGHVSELGSIHSGLTEPGYHADIKWHDDEYMLILTFLLNYRLLKDYYSFYHVDLSIDNQIMILIGDFRYTIKNRENYKNAFHSASLIIKSREKEINKAYLAIFFDELGLAR